MSNNISLRVNKMEESEEVFNIELKHGGFYFLEDFLTSEDQSNLFNPSLDSNDRLTNPYLLNIIKRILDKDKEYPNVSELYRYAKTTQSIKLLLKYEDNISHPCPHLVATLLIGNPCRFSYKSGNIIYTINVKNNDVLVISPCSSYISHPELKMYNIYTRCICRNDCNIIENDELKFEYTPKIPNKVNEYDIFELDNIF